MMTKDSMRSARVRPFACVVLLACILAHGEEMGVSGRWKLKVESSRGPGAPTFTFEQDGEKLSGQYKGTFGGAAVTGTVKGNEIEFSYPGYVNGEKTVVSYYGTIEGSSMKGKVEFGEKGKYGTGTFTGGRAVSASSPTVPSRSVTKSSMETAVTPEVMSFLAAHVKDLVSQVEVRRDVVFAEAPEKKLLLDVYSPKDRSDAPLPCVVWIHGGALKSLSKDWNLIRWCAAYTARAGFVSVSIDYRLLQEAELPAAIIDAKTAVRFVRAHAKDFGIDPSRIAVAGESAGGYLAAFVAFAADAPEFQSAREADTKEDVACAVIWYTPVWPELTFHPLDYISKGDPPALFVHGDHDSLVNPADSKTFVDRCHAVGATAEMLFIKNAEHGLFDINGNVEAYQAHMTEALDATVAFLRKQLD